MRSSLSRLRVVAAVSLLPLLSCTEGEGAGAAAGGPRPRGTLSVRRGDFVAKMILTGQLRAVRAEEVLVPRLPGWTVQIRWLERDGAKVEEGQKVAELDSAGLVSTLEEKKVAREKAASELALREAEIASQIADREFQVEQRRIAVEKARIDSSVPEDLVPARQWQERRLALVRAETELEKAIEELDAFRKSSAEELRQKRIAIEKAEREIRAAERALEQAVLRAPKSGILVVADHPWEGRKLEVGDSVWPGMTIVHIPSLAEMQVDASLVDVDDGKVAPGMPASCTLDAYPDLVFPGRLVEVSSVAQEAEWRSLRRTFRVTVALERADPERMRPGMSARVEVETARREGVLLIPREALDLSEDPPRALLADGGRAEVTLGLCNATECILEGGLADGTSLRASGGHAR